MTTCTSVYRDSYFRDAEGVPCTRTDTHWQHQNWEGDRRINWTPGGSSMANRHPDPVEAARVNWDQDYACTRCGTREYWHWALDRVEPEICFSCNFWLRLIAQPGNAPQRVIVDGRHYQVGPAESTPGPGSGFGGAKYDILMHDGRRIITRNLWTQGNIPAEWRDQLPDNATFEHVIHPGDRPAYRR